MTRSPRLRDSSSWSAPLQHGINVNHDRQYMQRLSSNFGSALLDTLPEAGHHSGSLSNSVQDSPPSSGTNPQNLNIQLDLAPSTTLNLFLPRNESDLVQQGVSSLFSLGATGHQSGREEIITREDYGGGFEGGSFITYPEAAFQRGMNYLRSSKGRFNSAGAYSTNLGASDMNMENNGDLGLDEELRPMASSPSQLRNVPITPLAPPQRDSLALGTPWTMLAPSILGDQPSRSTTNSITPETTASKFAAAETFGPCSRTWELPPRVSIYSDSHQFLYLLTLHEEAAA